MDKEKIKQKAKEIKEKAEEIEHEVEDVPSIFVPEKKKSGKAFGDPIVILDQ